MFPLYPPQKREKEKKMLIYTKSADACLAQQVNRQKMIEEKKKKRYIYTVLLLYMCTVCVKYACIFFTRPVCAI